MTQTWCNNLNLRKIWISGIGLVGLILIAIQCQEPQPIINNFSPPSASVTVNKSIAIQVNVTTNGYTIDRYEWAVDTNGGKFISNGRAITTYHAPMTPGSYEISVKLHYSGGVVEDSMIVDVVPEHLVGPEAVETAKAAMATAEAAETAHAAIVTAIANTTATAIATQGAKATAANRTATAIAIQTADAAVANETAAAATTEAETELTAVIDVANETATAIAIQNAEANATKTPAITPTPVPTPIPADAVVTAEDGTILFKKPGPGHDPIRTLSRGDVFFIKKRVHIINMNESKEITYEGWWIGVSSVDELSDNTEGWVEYNPTGSTNAIALTKEWEETPEIYQFGPLPTFPQRSTSRSVDEPTIFTWTDYPLKEHQFYSIIIIRAGSSSDNEACIHTQVTMPQIELEPEKFGCTSGPYYWGVGIGTDLAQIDETKILQGQGGGAIWRDDSVFDERFPLGLSDVAPVKPIGPGNGGPDPGHLPPDP